MKNWGGGEGEKGKKPGIGKKKRKGEENRVDHEFDQALSYSLVHLLHVFFIRFMIRPAILTGVKKMREKKRRGGIRRGGGKRKKQEPGSQLSQLLQTGLINSMFNLFSSSSFFLSRSSSLICTGRKMGGGKRREAEEGGGKGGRQRFPTLPTTRSQRADRRGTPTSKEKIRVLGREW